VKKIAINICSLVIKRSAYTYS